MTKATWPQAYTGGRNYQIPWKAAAPNRSPVETTAGRSTSPARPAVARLPDESWTPLALCGFRVEPVEKRRSHDG